MSELEELYNLEETAGVALAASKEIIDKLDNKDTAALVDDVDTEGNSDNLDKNDNL